MPKVVALQMGFYNGSRVRAGTECDVPEGYTADWFAPLETPAAKSAAKTAKGPGAPTPQALSQLGKQASRTFVEAHAKDSADLV